MILADTSVWVDHFRTGNPRLAALLGDDRVACHPFVVGELACGNLRDRHDILGYFQHLPEVPVATHAEALRLVTAHGLEGSGVGWIDVHLLASALLATASLWTLDRQLRAAARRVGCAAGPDVLGLPG